MDDPRGDRSGCCEEGAKFLFWDRLLREWRIFPGGFCPKFCPWCGSRLPTPGPAAGFPEGGDPFKVLEGS